MTDNGNYIVDLSFKANIKDVKAAAQALKNTVGVVDHGIFEGMTYQVSPPSSSLHKVYEP